MGMYDRDYARTITLEETRSRFGTRVYGWMTLGLATTALVAFYLMASGLYIKLLPFWFVPMIGTLVFAFTMNGAVRRLSFPALSLCFLGYAVLKGLFFGLMLPLYAAQFGGQVIWLAFLTAAVIFGSATLYGMMTRADLTRLSRIFQIALMGLFALTLLYVIMSFFAPVSGLMLLISYVGLAIFVGMTAVDAQRIRLMSEQAVGDSVALRKLSLVCALQMYLNVIMIFWYLLQIFSSSRR